MNKNKISRHQVTNSTTVTNLTSQKRILTINLSSVMIESKTFENLTPTTAQTHRTT